jgi:hypothetical protein
MTTSGHFLAAIGNLGFDMRLIGRMALGAALGYVVDRR